VFLQRIYVLFFISLATRRIEYIACSSNPYGRWTTQQARNLVMQLGEEQPFRFHIHDGDTKFSHAFDQVFRGEGIKVIRTPVQAPNANASPSAGRAPSALTASTGSSSSAGATSNMCSASTAATTTSTGHTARWSYCLPTVATPRRLKRLLAYTAVTSSADSSTNTRPPEFANPTRSR
jgi:hypothetical protein